MPDGATEVKRRRMSPSKAQVVVFVFRKHFGLHTELYINTLKKFLAFTVIRKWCPTDVGVFVLCCHKTEWVWSHCKLSKYSADADTACSPAEPGAVWHHHCYLFELFTSDNLVFVKLRPFLLNYNCLHKLVNYPPFAWFPFFGHCCFEVIVVSVVLLAIWDGQTIIFYLTSCSFDVVKIVVSYSFTWYMTSCCQS